MMWKSLVTCMALAVVFGATSPVEAEVTVGFDAQDSVIDLAIVDTVEVNIIADFTLPIIAWGLDLTIETPGIASLIDVEINSSLWDWVYTPDGDGLAGLAPIPTVVGPGVDFVLATLTFHGDAIGVTPISLSYTLIPPDETEGFAKHPTGFDEVIWYEEGTITVIPEPGTLSVLALGGLALLRRRG
ncbi:MAG: PEP-CTERM sorting domain-containing protein [Planctomycetota bacterium]